MIAAADTSISLPAWAVTIGAGSAIVTPLINAWMRRIDRRADWKRQDEVARRVEEANSNQKHIRKSLHAVLDEVNCAKLERQNLGEQLGEIQSQGEVIHGLVNGHLSAAMESELDSKRTQLTLMREIVALKGGHPSQDTKEAIASLETAIRELSAKVSDRRQNVAATNSPENTDGTKPGTEAKRGRK